MCSSDLERRPLEDDDRRDAWVRVAQGEEDRVRLAGVLAPVHEDGVRAQGEHPGHGVARERFHLVVGADERRERDLGGAVREEDERFHGGDGSPAPATLSAMVRVRLFAILRDLAGASEVTSEGSTVAEVLADLGGRYGERFARVASQGSVVVDGERAAPERDLAGAGEVALLPPFSGG